VILGSTYALLGIGLTLIFGIMRVVNFTHGELYALGAYAVFFLEVSLGVNFFLALVLAVIIGCAVGAAIEFVLLRPLLDADIDTTMLVMIGAWIVMQNTELFYWGGVSKAIMTPFPDEPLQVGPIFVSWLRLFVLVMALILIAATYVLINRTKLGKAMRATFQDRDTAALMGVNIKGIYTATFAIGSGLAAAAGPTGELHAAAARSGERDIAAADVLDAAPCDRPRGGEAEATRNLWRDLRRRGLRGTDPAPAGVQRLGDAAAADLGRCLRAPCLPADVFRDHRVSGGAGRRGH